MSDSKHRRITLAARPRGAPQARDFALVEDAVPAPGSGELLLRTIYLSLDPYMRGRMNPVKSYSAFVEVGET
ncbi:MAG: NADP-dependent oxidoreductase, partial [Gammaproteobacteria bacterium]|nr:NADP-dependent oxidoreductase [Gammaproteobacteria bacterium]